MTLADVTNLISFTGAAFVMSADIAVVVLMGGTYLLAGHLKDGQHVNIAALWATLAAAFSFWVNGSILQVGINILPGWSVGYFLSTVFALSVILLLLWVTGLAFFMEEWRQLIRRRNGRVGEAQVARVIRRAGYTALNDVYVGHAGEFAQLDHLVLAGSRLVVLETKNYGGDVFGQADDATWTLRNEDKEASFVPNPIPQNERQVRILNAAHGTNAEGWVVFARMTRLPKGLPERTVDLATVAELFAHLADSHPRTEQGEASALLVIESIRGSDQGALANEHRRARVQRGWAKPQGQSRSAEGATVKQVEFGRRIALALGIDVPAIDDKSVWDSFIKANLDAFNATSRGQRWKGAA